MLKGLRKETKIETREVTRYYFPFRCTQCGWEKEIEIHHSVLDIVSCGICCPPEEGYYAVPPEKCPACKNTNAKESATEPPVAKTQQ